ncbi:MAG: DUF4832 domain-containing protein [Ruminococcus sp.]|nr:DUF4832 domain-containing protein [Ruminococcus sp.]
MILKIKRAISVITATVILSSIVPAKTFAEEAKLKDSGIDYSESVETISNPAAGYSSTIWPTCRPGNTPVYNPTAKLALFFIDIGEFSCGVNGTYHEDDTYTEGTDYDLDEAFFEAWDETFENCRKNGCMIAMRFRYDDLGKDNPEPATFEQVLRHIGQIKESGLLEKYADIIAFVEAGFVGKWGEMHGGKYVTVDYKAKVLEAMLQAVPSPIPVTVRTPDIFAEWAGIERKELNNYELIDSITESEYSTTIHENKDRVGLFNDGYMGSINDLGTFSNREIETDWIGHQAVTSYYGGEFSGSHDYAKSFETYLPENAIPEMYKTHLSYINSNIFPFYKDFTFSEEYTVEGVNNSAYYGQNVFQFIRDHIGYRFVIRKSELTPTTEQGGNITVNFSIENTGFASVIPAVQSYVVLEKDGVFAYAEADTDCRQWLSCVTTDNTLNIKLPDNLPAGEWNVMLKLNMGTPLSITNMTGRSIRFANKDVWDSSIGANFLGTVTVTESDSKGTDNSITVNGSSNGTPVQFYSLNGRAVIDGIVSSPLEWTEDMIVAENEEGIKLYAKADDHNFYVMSTAKQNAIAPVYNLQLRNNGEFYWIYYANNGFIYFNHDDYNGCRCVWSDNMVEFKIPFEVMGLSAGTELTDLRISMQDSGNEWVVKSDVKSATAVVGSDFFVISQFTDVRLNNGKNYTYNVIAETMGDTDYQWYRNGELLHNFTSDKLSLENITSSEAGEYSVKITASSGVEKTIPAFKITVVDDVSEYCPGDANCDGLVSIADAAAIFQSIGNSDKYALSEKGMINADVDGEKGITASDALIIQKLDAGLIEDSELQIK